MTLDTAPGPAQLHPVTGLIIAVLAFTLMVLGLALIVTNTNAPAFPHISYSTTGPAARTVPVFAP